MQFQNPWSRQHIFYILLSNTLREHLPCEAPAAKPSFKFHQLERNFEQIWARTSSAVAPKLGSSFLNGAFEMELRVKQAAGDTFIQAGIKRVLTGFFAVQKSESMGRINMRKPKSSNCSFFLPAPITDLGCCWAVIRLQGVAGQLLYLGATVTGGSQNQVKGKRWVSFCVFKQN